MLLTSESVLIAPGPIVELGFFYDFLGFSDLGPILDCFLQSLLPLDCGPLLLGVVAVVGVTQPQEGLLSIRSVLGAILGFRHCDRGVLQRIGVWGNVHGDTLSVMLQVLGCVEAPQTSRVIGAAVVAPGFRGVFVGWVPKLVTTDGVQALLELIVQTAFDTLAYGVQLRPALLSSVVLLDGSCHEGEGLSIRTSGYEELVVSLSLGVLATNGHHSQLPSLERRCCLSGVSLQPEGSKGSGIRRHVRALNRPTASETLELDAHLLHQVPHVGWLLVAHP